MIVALVLTVISMLDYLAKCRSILRFVPGEGTIDSTEVAREDPAVLSEEIIARAAALIVLALEKGAKLSTAESCTGGLIAGSLTAVPGSSSVVEGGVVSYSNEVKHHLLNVSASDLEHYGAVSEPVAIPDGAGVHAGALSTTVAVAVTGVAGPGGGSPEKPVGTVWFGVDSPRGSRAEVMHFAGDRASVREQTVAHALMLFEDELAAL